MAAQAELLALAERQVAEPSRPLSDRKAETVTPEFNSYGRKYLNLLDGV